jgi:pyruvate dehydrogenase E2 component (dihydrolipoamide acetyltransferase)
MKHEIKVPEVSEGVTEGTVVDIAVAVGNSVEVDQTLLEFETDKAVIAIPSPQGGKVSEIKVSQGDMVKVGAVIMILDAADDADDDSTEVDSSAEAGQAEPELTAGQEASREPEPDAETGQQKSDLEDAEEEESVAEEEPKQEAKEKTEKEETKKTEPDKAKKDRIESDDVDLVTVRRGDRVAPAAPSVRRMARELGVDIYQVQGTGPGERISEQDVRSFVRVTMQRITGGGSAPVVHGEFPGLHAQRPLPDFSKWGAITREPLSRVRELTADAMSYAWSTIPMVTQYDQAQVSEIEAFRQEYNRRAISENRLTMTAILVKVCAAALKAFPRFNSSLDLASKELVLKQYVHVGVAVDTPAGLLVPVIRDADRKGIETLALELNEIAEKTRERKIGPEVMEGGTFTISNLGGVGGTSFTPVVYAPQVAILGVSTATLQPEWDGEQFVPRLIMPLSLTYDHRVIDGADGARFLRWICEALDNPLQLVMKG